jgi:hypothetical protein
MSKKEASLFTFSSMKIFGKVYITHAAMAVSGIFSVCVRYELFKGYNNSICAGYASLLAQGPQMVSSRSRELVQQGVHCVPKIY